jgi:hypothetical protein
MELPDSIASLTAKKKHPGHALFFLQIKHDYGKSQWLGNPQFQWFMCFWDGNG